MSEICEQLWNLAAIEQRKRWAKKAGVPLEYAGFEWRDLAGLQRAFLRTLIDGMKKPS